MDAEWDLADVGDVARGNGATINDFKGTGLLEEKQRQVVLTRKLFVYERESSCTNVKESVSGDRFIIMEDLTADRHMEARQRKIGYIYILDH